MKKDGRLALLNSVLTAIVTHQLLMSTPPKFIKVVDKIRRGFHWRHVLRPMECMNLGGIGESELEPVVSAAEPLWS
jgi:hypothetical protein